MRFIHSGNVCQKEVITFSIIWEECKQEEARLIIREENMGAIQDNLPRLKEDPSSDEEYEGINS